jgi:hypothetical protein
MVDLRTDKEERITEAAISLAERFEEVVWAMVTSSAAEYIFRVRVHLTPQADVRLDPQRFETTLFWPAASPGTEGWLFFRNHLWRGEVNDEPHLRDLTETALDIPVETVEFRELRTNAAYLNALKEAIANELDTQSSPFGNATNVDEVLKKYLGSSIHVQSSNQWLSRWGWGKIE